VLGCIVFCLATRGIARSQVKASFVVQGAAVVVMKEGNHPPRKLVVSPKEGRPSWCQGLLVFV